MSWDYNTQTVTLARVSNGNSEPLSLPNYVWEFNNKVYKLDPAQYSSLEDIDSPTKAMVILHQYRHKNHPLLQQKHPDLQGPLLQWLEKTVGNYSNNQDNHTIITGISSVLKELAEKDGLNSDYDLAQFVLSFCQGIPYTKDSPPEQFLIGFDEYPKYPVETLLDNAGDCEDKSILAAVLLKELGYDTAVILYLGHVAIGVNIPNLNSDDKYYQYGNIKYYFAETTATGWKIGEIPQELETKSYLVFPI